jgi:hypothetical protein
MLAGVPALCAPAATANGAGTLLRGARRLHLNGAAVHHHLGVSAFSEYAVVDRASAVVIDDDVPFPVAAMFGCALLTGVGAVQNTVLVRPGESVAVFGLGGVGLSAVLGAALAGAYPLIAVDPVPAKQDLARELGATHALHPDEDWPPEAAGGVQYAVEAVGSAAVVAAAYAATGPRRHDHSHRAAAPVRGAATARDVAGRRGEDARRLVPGFGRAAARRAADGRAVAGRPSARGATAQRDPAARRGQRSDGPARRGCGGTPGDYTAPDVAVSSIRLH